MKQKIYHYLLSFFLIIPVSIYANDTIKLALEPHIGFGDFSPSYGVIFWRPMSPNNPWISTQIDVKGIPNNWTNTVTKQIWFDSKQFAFQNYKQGKITKDRFIELIDAWNIDTLKNLSPKPLKCFVYIVIGKDENDSIVYKIDSNHDFDFADEKTNYPTALHNLTDSLVKENCKWIKAEFQINHKIISRNIPLFIAKDSDGGVLYNFPQYYTASLNKNCIKVTSKFSSLSFYNTYLTLDSNKNTELIQKGEYIKLGNTTYKNLGADFRTMTLSLQKITNDSLIYSSQIGFLAKPFSGNVFTTDSLIKLADLKGKYVYLDFWGSWCKPCVKELENIKKAYSMIDKNKIEFIGIAEDGKKSLQKAIDKYGIDWPQILSSANNDIVKLYGVTEFPTTILIDTEGKIIAKNIRGENLLKILTGYIK